MHIMSNHHNCYPFFIQPAKELHNLCIMVKILSRSWLIQNDQFRILHQHTGNGHTLLLPEAKRRYRPVPKWEKSADFQSFLHFFPNLFLAFSHIAKAQCHLIKNHGLGNHLIGILHHIADMFGSVADIFLQKIPSLEKDFTGIWCLKAADQFGKSRFPSTVFPHNTDHFTLVDCKRNIT